MIKKGEIERTFIRLFYLALADVPVNWVEGTFSYKFDKFAKELTCIDNVYKVLDTTKYKILQKNNISVLEYLKRKPFVDFPVIEGDKFSQQRMEEYLNKIFKRIKDKYDKGDKKARKLMSELKIVKSPNEELPFDGLKQANIFRALLFRNDPLEVRKGSNLLIALLTLWGILNGDITGEGTENLKKIVDVYACFAKKLNIDPNEVWKLLNEVLETNYKYEFNCEKYEL